MGRRESHYLKKSRLVMPFYCFQQKPTMNAAKYGITKSSTIHYFLKDGTRWTTTKHIKHRTWTYGWSLEVHWPRVHKGLIYNRHLSHEKNPGWLFYIRDYTTQLYRDYNKPL